MTNAKMGFAYELQPGDMLVVSGMGEKLVIAVWRVVYDNIRADVLINGRNVPYLFEQLETVKFVRHIHV